MVETKDLELLPHSEELEKYCISALLSDKDLIQYSPLTAGCFFVEVYRDIYKAMIELQQEERDVDVVNVIDKLSSRYSEEMLFDIASYAMSTLQFDDKAIKLLEYHNRRTIIQELRKLEASCKNKDGDFGKILTGISDIPNKVKTLGKTQDIIPIETFQKLFDDKQTIAITDTSGYKVLDKFVRGYRRGSLWVIGARPSMGKSTLALNMILELVDQGIQTCIFSTEMPAHEIHIRVMSNIGGVPSQDIEKGKQSIGEGLSQDILNYDRKAKCNIYDDFDTFENLEVLIAKEATNGTEVMFIDYLQQVGSNDRVYNRNNFIGRMTRKLKKLAIKYGICIIMMAQLNRGSQEKQVPSLSDFRDSGNIEQDVDIAIVLHYYDDMGELTNHIIKNRHGEKGIFTIGYSPSTFNMYDI